MASSCDQAEEALDQIDPGRRSRREVEMEARMAFEPPACAPTSAYPSAASREASFEPRARLSPHPEASCGQAGLHRAADLRQLVQHSDHASDTPCVWSCQSHEQFS